MKTLSVVLLLLTATVPFWDIGHPLWEVDDARYAEVPREMHESGNWLTPSLNYVDYVEKPPMIYWQGALSYSLFGVSEGAARAPLAVLFLLGLLGIYWLGNWLYAPRVGLGAALMLGTCVQYCALGHLITPDMSVSVALLWATALILRCLRHPEDGLAGALAWVAMTAAFLSKGLIAVVFPGIWTTALIFFFPDLRKGLKPLLINPGLPVFLLVVGGWFYAMEKANPGFFGVFVVEQHFQRFLDTQKYNRPGPWYFFIGVDLIGSLPWTPLFAAGALLPFLRWKRSDARDRMLALWVALIFLFFSVSSSKLITYILPLFAHQALLGARLMDRLRGSPRLDGLLRKTAGGLCAVFAAAAVAAPAVVSKLDLPIAVPGGLLACATGLLAALALSLLVFARGRRAESGRTDILGMTAAALVMIACLTAGSGFLDDELSVKRMGRELSARLHSLPPGRASRILAYNKYLHGIPFYTRRPVDVVNWIGEMHYAKRFARFQDRFGDDATIRALPDPARKVFVTVPKRDLENFLRLAPREKLTALDDFGPWLLAEF